jgi:hypothetical protein
VVDSSQNNQDDSSQDGQTSDTSKSNLLQYSPFKKASTATTDDNVEFQARKNFLDLLKSPPRNFDDSSISSSPYTQHLIGDLAGVQDPTSGIVTVFNRDASAPGGQHPLFDLTPDNIVGIRAHGNLNDNTYLASDEHIDSLLKGAMASKLANPPPADDHTAVVKIQAPNDTSKMMMAYAAELANLQAGDANGNKIDTSTLDQGIKDKMKAAYDKMNAKYNDPNFTPGPIVQPKLDATQVAQLSVSRATNLFTSENIDINTKDPASVSSSMIQWASTLADNPNAAAAKGDITTFMGKINDQESSGNINPAAVVDATNDLLANLKAKGVNLQGADEAPLENIALATQAFAAQNNVTIGDAGLYHDFQPHDTTLPEQLPAAAQTQGKPTPAAQLAP